MTDENKPPAPPSPPEQTPDPNGEEARLINELRERIRSMEQEHSKDLFREARKLRDYYLAQHAEERKALAQFRAEAEAMVRRQAELAAQEARLKVNVLNAVDGLRDSLEMLELLAAEMGVVHG